MAEARKTLHGTEYTDEDIIHFTTGLPGFENLRSFLLTMNPEHEPFVWLSSVENTQIRFLMVNPMLFRPDYAPKMNKEQIADLRIAEKEDLLLFVIVTLNPNHRLSTVNMAGPVLINIKEKLGKQVILDDGKYSIREMMMPEGD
ncbi:MAG TPA: flagellar assembly protein FliW [Fibrobacteraceae bacterium]|nr:flagellar assembly protein FliW [Fibrobacteraceae bacterium]